jgi:methyl-accepting chemotaxis protein
MTSPFNFAPPVKPAAPRNQKSPLASANQPQRSFLRRALTGFRADRAARAAAREARSDAIDATLHRLAALTEDTASEGYRAVDACTNLVRQSKRLSEGLITSEADIDHIAGIAAENGSASDALQADMGRTAEQLDHCVDQARNQSHLVGDLLRSVERSRSGFEEVNTCVDEVERFLTIVHEIGNQAGLLALNAAIEAASAGEHGQGFFVVASEMRRLADKTAATIEQTRRMTVRMRASTAAAAELIQAACVAARPSQQRGEELITAIVGCSDTVRQAGTSAQRFASASQQQIDAVGTMHNGLQTMRLAAFNCTFDADATAEMSLHTLNLSVGLYTELHSLGENLQCDESVAGHRLQQFNFGLLSAAASCRDRAGFSELERARPSIFAAVNMLEKECLRRGAPSRRGRSREGDRLPDLCFGATSLNGSDEPVDSIRRQTGFSATLFVCSDELDGSHSFHRVATTVTRRDGGRAIGTQLNPRGTVARKLAAGESTFGYVYILGVPYISAYLPLRDVVGELVGALYCGRAVGGRDTISNGRDSSR